MDTPNELHVYLPADFYGIVHLHLGADEAENASPRPALETSAASDTESMLEKFEAFDPTTQARKVHDALCGTGWIAYVPRSRDGSKNKNTYLRLVYTSRRRVTLYLNTASIVSTGAKERDFISKLHGVSLRGADAYLPINQADLDQTLGSIESLRLWAESDA
jgi:hypothetical protein